jgi:predicted short-subunit dehydrogenase-like oxidoreductase (DUF2520 family)
MDLEDQTSDTDPTLGRVGIGREAFASIARCESRFELSVEIRKLKSGTRNQEPESRGQGSEVSSRRAEVFADASAMLPGMKAKPGIAIVGAGSLATALAVSLRGSDYKIEEVIARERGASLLRARALARKTGARAVVITDADIAERIVWFCVPDSAIEQAARVLSQKVDWKNKIALHSSGALTSDELSVLRKRGAAVASVHPLMTFVHGSQASLAGVPFAIEGDAAAVRVGRRIVKDLKGSPYLIQKKNKVAYHAWATFVSPLFTALLATAEQVAVAAGVSAHEARKRALPILRQTLANYASSGAAAGFSGPIIRGDVQTVLRHLRVLREIPAAREAYIALAEAAVQYLPAKNRADLRKALRDSFEISHEGSISQRSGWAAGRARRVP